MFSQFANSVVSETAFSVLARAEKLEAAGKDVIRLEIGDSPFASATPALLAGSDAILADECHYVSSKGIDELRREAASYVSREHGVRVDEDNILVGNGAKIFQQLFCELFLDPGDGALVFSPFFPTYSANIARRGGRLVTSKLSRQSKFRPSLADVKCFLEHDDSPRAVFLNSPHNPTGGVTTEEDVADLCSLILDRDDVFLFSDEPYDQMSWSGRHVSPLAHPDMLERCVAVYTMSKSYSMSGWRVGFAASSKQNIEKLSVLANTSFSCVSPFSQIAAAAALREGNIERDERMHVFRERVERFASALQNIDGVKCLVPDGAFYVFPDVSEYCTRYGITSHGLAMYLLEAADSKVGVSCLGGEAFGEDGYGYIRMSCAESADRLRVAAEFLEMHLKDSARVKKFVADNPSYRAMRL